MYLYSCKFGHILHYFCSISFKKYFGNSNSRNPNILKFSEYSLLLDLILFV